MLFDSMLRAGYHQDFDLFVVAVVVAAFEVVAFAVDTVVDENTPSQTADSPVAAFEAVAFAAAGEHAP